MTSPTATALLDAASICRHRPAAEAAVHLATLGLPELTVEACADLAIGTRDAALADLRAAMFGTTLDLRATCPGCATALDVATSTDELRTDAVGAAVESVLIDGRSWRVRAATSTDLAAVAASGDAETARTLLARRCLVAEGGATLPPTLDPDTVDAIAAALATIDPNADPYASLACAVCEATWDAPIDIARILADEVVAAADILIDDIHDLARAYHWSEDVILALAPDRRRAYLDRLRA